MMTDSRNICGYRAETVAAEYETDQALKELGINSDYFNAAFKAEAELRAEDIEWIQMNMR